MGAVSAESLYRSLERGSRGGTFLIQGEEEYLKDQANVPSFRVGKGYVFTYGSQVDFRTQPRATFRLIFNALFHGPSTPVTAAQMGR